MAPPTPAAPAAGRRLRALQQARPIASSLALPPAHVGVIEQSHERCTAQGLSPIERADFAPLGRADLAVVRERNLRLHNHAAPVMEMLFDQIAGTESMVVLCDASGTIIHSIGDHDFLSRASQVALQPGVNWAEPSKGTNAIGTALVEEQPTLVHADEHFLHANHFLTCSAAPILDPRGNILGVLDVTGDHRSYHQHTMALVRMSARMIENHWLSDDCRNALRLHVHSRPEFIGTLMEGILAVAADGRITGANRGALEQLGLSGAALRMHSLASLFGTTVAALADRFRSPLATPVAVRTEGGQPLYLQARFNGPVWRELEAQPGAAVGTFGPAGHEGHEGPAGHAGHEGPAGPVASAGPLAAALMDPQRAIAAGVAPQSATGTTPAVAGVTAAPRRPAAAASPGLAHLLTGDPKLAAVVAQLRRVLDSGIPVLVLGETGTGKEMLARAMHQDSQRCRQPFVAVNCAALPAAQIEAELFGHEEGVFTGARRKAAVGKVLQAHGGTLFLDEIGDMPPPLQAQLLRVLQERQVTPVGGARAVPFDVALICATHHNLRVLIEAKAFREDLYYRLNGLAVKLPPLRERTDLQALVRRMLNDHDHDHDHGAGDGPPLRLSADVMALFQSCGWPGNVRQLFNVLRAAVAMVGADRLITPGHLPGDFMDDVRAQPAATAATGPVPAAAAPQAGCRPAAAAPKAAGATLQDLELQAIKAAVDAAQGNIFQAALQLGISRNTVYRKLRGRSAARR